MCTRVTFKTSRRRLGGRKLRKNNLLKVTTIVLAAMIAVTCVPVNAYAMDGESFEDSEIVSEEIQEDTNEEVNEEVNVETYNEDIEEAVEAEEVAEEAVETAAESLETVEAIVEENNEAGLEAASVEDGGKVAEEGVKAFVEAVENLDASEDVKEAATALETATEELAVADEADRKADENATKAVENVVAAQYIADSAAKEVAEAQAQADDLVEVIAKNDATAEEITEAYNKLDKLTDNTKENIEIKKVAFEALSDKYEQAKKELIGAQKVYEETVKVLKSDDSNVAKAAERLENAKNKVEALSEACDNAKVGLEKELAAVEDINEKKIVSDAGKDYLTQDYLMESILSGYIIPNFIDKDATNITYSKSMQRGFDRQNSSHLIVTYTDKDNNQVVRYFNLDRVDRQFKDNDQWYRLGSSREIVIFEKPLEDITSSQYQTQHYGKNLHNNMAQFKKDVNAGVYDVYSFDYADGSQEFKGIDELEAGVENGDIEKVDGVYYMNGIAARKIVQTTSGNAKLIRVSTKDDEGLKAFIDNAAKLVEKYEKYGESIADAQDKIDEAADKVEALEVAIEGIDENSKRVSDIVSKDLVAGLRTYVSEENIARLMDAETVEDAVKILDEILAAAKEDLENAETELVELIEKRDEIGRKISEETKVAVVEDTVVEDTTETVAEVAEVSEVAADDNTETAPAVVDAEANVAPMAMVTVAAAKRAEASVANVQEAQVAGTRTAQGSVLGARNNRSSQTAGKKVFGFTPVSHEKAIMQILGAKRINVNNNDFVVTGDSAAAYADGNVAGDVASLIKNAADDMNKKWWWIFLLPFMSIFGGI